MGTRTSPSWAFGLLIHHAGKAGAQRGTSRREDVLDTVIALRRPDGYSSDQGAKFIVEFEKARGLYGPDANPFEAAYREDNGGVASWYRTEMADAQTLRVANLINEGSSIREVAEITGLSKTKTHRLKQKAEEDGLLKKN